MGCPCRQIRAAIELLPGGRFFTGLLPALPPTSHLAKGPAMKMLARVPGQSFHLSNGAHYFADDARVVHVLAEDVAEMARLGCTEAPADEAAPEKAEAPVDPVAQEIMRAEPASEAEPAAQ
jgi:hypothetical protein